MGQDAKVDVTRLTTRSPKTKPADGEIVAFDDPSEEKREADDVCFIDPNGRHI